MQKKATLIAYSANRARGKTMTQKMAHDKGEAQDQGIKIFVSVVVHTHTPITLLWPWEHIGAQPAAG